MKEKLMIFFSQWNQFKHLIKIDELNNRGIFNHKLWRVFTKLEDCVFIVIQFL